MFSLPALPPSWDGFHPLFVHFPVALLAVAPLFILLGAITGLRSLMVSALILMVLGVGGAFLASNTGEAAYEVYSPDEAAEIIDPDYAYDDAATEHGELAEFARNFFALAMLGYAGVVAVAFVKPSSTHLKPRLIVGLIFLLATGWGNLIMANAAHMGGELVHIYGMRATMSPPESEEEEEEEADESDETVEAEPAS